jgi:daunorubicin resistance ABC transporter ATP-binding subunit
MSSSPPARPPAITVTGLTKSFGVKVVLDGIDLAVAEGAIFALLGPNGAGKTTAVQILSTLLPADAGAARVAGHDLAAEPDAVRAAIGVTGQFSAVDNLLTGEENLRLMTDLHHLGRAAGRQRAADLLRQFGLEDAAGKMAATYSGGMRRRLDLAASLIQRPQVLFLDEPTTGLDPRSRGEVWAMIRTLVGEGTTVLLTTQYLDEADRLAGEITVIDHGRVIAAGTAAELKAKVGQQTLDVRPADPADLGETAAIVTAVVGRAPVSTAEDPGLLSVAVDDAQVLPAVVGKLQAGKVEVTELALRLASLDEVFMALTGHAAVEEGTS